MLFTDEEGAKFVRKITMVEEWNGLNLSFSLGTFQTLTPVYKGLRLYSRTQ
jgi:hypothetical protein